MYFDSSSDVLLLVPVNVFTYHFLSHGGFRFRVGHQDVFVIDLPEQTGQLLFVDVVPVGIVIATGKQSPVES